MAYLWYEEVMKGLEANVCPNRPYFSSRHSKLSIVLQSNLKSIDRISRVEQETWFLMRVTFISTFALINNKLCYSVLLNRLSRKANLR